MEETHGHFRDQCRPHWHGRYKPECLCSGLSSYFEKRKSSLRTLINGTNIEGELRDLLRIALKMHQIPFQRGALRVLTTLKIDDRRDKKGTLEGKKRAVQRKL